MKKHALGIDLGTTFCKVSVVLSEIFDLVADKNGNKRIPSIINYSKNGSDISVLVGDSAKDKQIRFQKSTIYDTKRMLGKSYDDENIQKMISKWPFKLEKSETGSILINMENIGEKKRPYEISGDLLKYLAKVGNSRLPQDEQTNDVVITVPANFRDEQRSETLEAAKLAGLNVLTLLNEPTAAGLAFGHQNLNTIHGNVFVFDFGGGTLDVSLLSINNSKIVVKETDGDMFLGGRDFDENTVEYLLQQPLVFKKIGNNKRKRQKLINKVSLAKNQLSDCDESTIDFDYDNDEEDGEDNSFHLTLELFEQINQKLIDRILIPIKNLLSNAKVKPNEIESIILVGGSSQMQFVKRLLTQFFGKMPFNGVNPQEAVALGAGIIAAKIIQDEKLPKRIKQMEFHDICPYSIGTSDSISGKMMIAIKKGTNIPFENVVQEYQTVFYRQDVFYVDILEGECDLAKDNCCIGSFKIENLPLSEKFCHFNISFSINKNGILSVKAKLIGGDLNGGTEIDITKENKNQNNLINNFKYSDSRFIDYEIFNKNIIRFIDFNKEKLLSYYTNKYIDRIVSEAQYNLDHIEEEIISIDDISDYFKRELSKYFNNNPVPDFFNYFEYF